MPARMQQQPPANLASASARTATAASSVSAFASGGRRGSSSNNNSVDAQQQKEAEEDALMNEMLSKHRSELQKFIGRAALGGDDDDDDDGDDDDALHFVDAGGAESPPPPAPPSSSGAGGFHDESYDELPSPDGFHTPRPVRSKTAERLLELSRTEEALRSDRMRLAELSDVRNERLGREVITRWNPQAKVAHSFEHHVGGGRRSPTARTRTPGTASPRTSAKILGYSKDFVQQALDFNGHDMDDDDDEDAIALAGAQSPTTRGLHESMEFVVGGDEDFRGRQSQVELRRYVKQMEETIAQLVQQKDELLRNQAEFDKHASGIFPSLEHLNHQLSQIVQGKMANSQVNIKVRTT